MNLSLAFRSIALCCSFLFSILSVQAAIADYQDNPDPLPGWTSGEAVEGDTEVKHGIALQGLDVIYSSPVVADIDGNPANGLETAAGSSDGIISVYRSDGILLWKAELPNHSCQFSGTTNKLLSSPAVGTIFGNGIPYVVVGYGGRNRK